MKIIATIKTLNVASHQLPLFATKGKIFFIFLDFFISPSSHISVFGPYLFNKNRNMIVVGATTAVINKPPAASNGYVEYDVDVFTLAR